MENQEQIKTNNNNETNDKVIQNNEMKNSEIKPAPQRMLLRVKRKANEDPLETLIIEGEIGSNKRQKPNPLFGFNFLEKMLNDLQISKEQQDQQQSQEQNQQKEQSNDNNKDQSNLFKQDENEQKETKQFVLTLVDKDNDTSKQIQQAKMIYAESNRKKARNQKLESNRLKLLDLTVDAVSKEVKVEKPKFNGQGDQDEDYDYYEVEERNKDNSDDENDQENINSLLSKQQDNIMLQNNNPDLFAGEFDPYRSDDFCDKDSQDSNRESAEENDYPDEEELDEEEEMDEDDEENRHYKEENYDNYNSNTNEFTKKKKSNKKMKNMFGSSIHGIYLGKQSSDNSMDQEDQSSHDNDHDDDDDDYNDSFNKKYTNYYHKRYDNDFNDDDYED